MTETPEAGDQNQERPDAPDEQRLSDEPEQPGMGNGTVEVAGQNGTAQPAVPAGAETQEAQSADEWAEEDEEESAQEEVGPEQAEADQRKKQLDEQQRQLEEASAQQEKWIKKQERERFIEFGKSGISLRMFEEPDARKEDQLFVPPPDYQRFVDEVNGDTGKHILIVAGKESSGKLMTAFYLARHAWKRSDLKCYSFSAQGNRTLLDIWADEKLPDNAVILFDEVFDKGQIDPDDLTNRYVHLNERLADKMNVWFIFTVLEGPILERLRAAACFPILSTALVDRRQVLERLIDYHFPRTSLSESKRARLLSVEGELPTPARLSQLFETESDPEAILRGFSPEEEQAQETPFVWFSQLKPMNYQLYALLAVLFDKLDMPTLEEIYTVAVHALRRQGMDGPEEFIDPRRIGTNLMHARLGIQVRYTVLEFRNRLYRQYVEAQVENYQRLLWSLIDPDDPSTFEGLVGLLRRLSEMDAQLTNREETRGSATASRDQARQLRYAIATMIARVGVYHQTKLDMLLEKLVRDESAAVSLTAAYVLAEIARRGGHFDYIERVLRSWTQSGRFTRMWAAAPSIAYIYLAIAGTLEEEHAPREEEGRDEAALEEDEEREVKESEEQKKRGQGYLARLRNMLTELAKVHSVFSKEAIDEASNSIFLAHLAGLRQHFEESSEIVTGENGRIFRELTDGDQQRFLLSVYAGNKKAIDKAVERDLGLLTNSWLNQMRMVLVQALAHIMQTWPRDVTRLVRM
ncbi:MAG TPA: hypothetical protein VHD63_29475, partial [Ktedonobacteraceae bacterium]|nr:hypothetical protein [Ktedonobacteraceae bacterium]